MREHVSTEDGVASNLPKRPPETSSTSSDLKWTWRHSDLAADGAARSKKYSHRSGLPKRRYSREAIARVDCREATRRRLTSNVLSFLSYFAKLLPASNVLSRLALN